MMPIIAVLLVVIVVGVMLGTTLLNQDHQANNTNNQTVNGSSMPVSLTTFDVPFTPTNNGFTVTTCDRTGCLLSTTNNRQLFVKPGETYKNAVTVKCDSICWGYTTSGHQLAQTNATTCQSSCIVSLPGIGIFVVNPGESTVIKNGDAVTLECNNSKCVAQVNNAVKEDAIIQNPGSSNPSLAIGSLPPGYSVGSCNADGCWIKTPGGTEVHVPNEQTQTNIGGTPYFLRCSETACVLVDMVGNPVQYGQNTTGNNLIGPGALPSGYSVGSCDNSGCWINTPGGVQVHVPGSQGNTTIGGTPYAIVCSPRCQIRDAQGSNVPSENNAGLGALPSGYSIKSCDTSGCWINTPGGPSVHIPASQSSTTINGVPFTLVCSPSCRLVDQSGNSVGVGSGGGALGTPENAGPGQWNTSTGAICGTGGCVSNCGSACTGTMVPAPGAGTHMQNANGTFSLCNGGATCAWKYVSNPGGQGGGGLPASPSGCETIQCRVDNGEIPIERSN